MTVLTRAISLVAFLCLAACATGPEGPPAPDSPEVDALRNEILALGPEVDPDEAARAARIAYVHTAELAEAYKITDPPLVHNTKVNMGLRPRGLCWHWAEDMEARLVAEDFQTLEIHRAIANSENPFRIDHSTAIVSRRGDTMFDGVVLDPWREGGRLTWVAVRSDSDYKWRPRAEVLRERYERQVARGEAPPLAVRAGG